VQRQSLGLGGGAWPAVHSIKLEGAGIMLVLTRKLGEKIIISEEICITVTDIGSGKVRLGIAAPAGVPIYRAELLARDDAAPAPEKVARRVALTA
jgi:carbon storage regulator